MKTTFRSILALVLVAGMGCATWRPYHDDPTEMRPKTLRLTLSDSTVCVLQRGWVLDGVAGGFRDGQERQVPLDRVAHVEEWAMDDAQTIILVSTGVLAVTACIFYLPHMMETTDRVVW